MINKKHPDLSTYKFDTSKYISLGWDVALTTQQQGKESGGMLSKLTLQEIEIIRHMDLNVAAPTKFEAPTKLNTDD